MGHYSTRKEADILIEGLQGVHQQIDLCHFSAGRFLYYYQTTDGEPMVFLKHNGKPL